MASSEYTVYSDEFVISAPVELVWGILTDFDNYSNWNEFCPSIRTELRLGAAVEMMVDLGNGLQPQTETMCRIEENRALAWDMELESRDQLYACRTQILTPLNETSCTYISTDLFAGELAASVYQTQGESVRKGFNLCAEGLKRYAEERFLSGD